MIAIDFRLVVKMDAKRELVLNLHLKGFKQIYIYRALKKFDINLKFVHRTVKRYNTTGTIKIKQKTGRKRSVRTKRLVKLVRDKIRRNPERSARCLAQDHNISRTTMRRVLKHDLKLKPFKKSKRHGLTMKSMNDRLMKCRSLVRGRAGSRILFSDEKLFLLQPSLNVQDDRIYAVSLTDIPTTRKSVQRFQNVPKVMVWGAVSKEHKFPLVFVDRGVRINGSIYRDEILSKNLLPHAEKAFRNQLWVFQQDGAPPHRANIVQQWLRSNVPDFIEKESWPPASPDLNPLDYFVWGYMLSKLKDLKIQKTTTIAKFKTKLI